MDKMNCHVLVTILSFNSFEEVDTLVHAVLGQKTSHTVKILVIDSSTDLEQQKKLDGIQGIDLMKIPNRKFGHGRTRQFAMEKALEWGMDFNIFIVQDALPANEEWIDKMVDPFFIGSEVASVFGKHVPYSHHNPLAKAWVNTTFHNISPDDTIRLHYRECKEVGRDFNSNVNAAYRVSYFGGADLRFEDVNYSEDQKIASLILSLGYTKVYTPFGKVFHSHNLSRPIDQFQRFFDDYLGLKRTKGSTGDRVTLLTMPKKVAREKEINRQYLKTQKLNFFSEWVWQRKSGQMAWAKFIALYLANNYTDVPASEYKYLSRDGMRKLLQKDRLGVMGRFQLRRLILQKILEFGKRGFSRGLNNNNHFPKLERKEGAITIQKESDTVSNSIYPLNYFYDFVLFKDGSVFTEVALPKERPLRISWIVPDFGIGSGGHLNIFRVIRGLELRGHECKVYIMPILIGVNLSEKKRLIGSHYLHLDAEIEVLSESVDDSDICICTSWQTAYPLFRIGNTKKKVYFIQDYECCFYPEGGERTFAEQTYQMGFKFISGGPWLHKVMSDRYGMKGSYFSLSYPKGIYFINENIPRQKKKVLFYARPVTSRRGFELGVLALKLLKQVIVDLHIVFIGWDTSHLDIPFVYENRGSLSFKELAHAYNDATLGLVISFTNYSLLPQEMMACGLPVVDIRTEANELNYREGHVVLAEPNPYDIMEKMKKLILEESYRNSVVKKALKVVGNRTISNQNDAIASMLREI